MNPEQLEAMAELAEEYSDDIAHITTRQDFQLHFIHIEDTPTIMRRLAAVGITTQEACGNSVRNVTACPLAGICRDEPFDVTPYARAMALFLLGHPDCQDFGRKFKISFSGCHQHSCGLATMHDVGLTAEIRERGGESVRGFRMVVGGGLGPVPHLAKLFDEFVEAPEILPTVQAIARVFARLGEKKNRARARLKFLVARLGVEEFRRLVLAEREELPEDPRWADFVADARAGRAPRGTSLVAEGVAPGAPPRPPEPRPAPEGFAAWSATNVLPQKQEGYAVAVVTLPLGDLSSEQMRRVAGLARDYADGSARTTVDQNVLLRWVSEASLPALYSGLREAGLGAPGAGSIADVTACPGTDTCKLGIASSRGLAQELRTRLIEQGAPSDAAVGGLHIKASGCFNSCGQHHVADLGFYGVSRKVAGRTVPHFQVVLGGQWSGNAASFGLAIGAVPSKRVPEAVERITRAYREEGGAGETFQAFVERQGKARIRGLLEDLIRVPAYEEDRSFYSDWGDPREFTTGDMGQGECAGEVVSRFDFGIAAAERQVFEAQLKLDAGDWRSAAETAFRAMLQAADALVRVQDAGASSEPGEVVRAFRERFVDTGLFADPYAGGKFAHYLFRAHGEGADGVTRSAARRRIEEAQLFIEASHSCHGRLSEVSGGVRA
jgi:sulfite reductase (ferredoxin)